MALYPSTSPDGIVYEDDYDRAADYPAMSARVANSIQAALDTQQGVLLDSDVQLGSIGGALAWDQYFPITAIQSAWSAAGAWAEFQPATLPGYLNYGTLEVHSHHYLEVTGGTAAEMTAFAGVQVLWSDGAGPAGQQRPTLGRLTVPKGLGPVTIGCYSILRLTNNPAKALRVRPSGQLAAAVAGGSARVGHSRVTIRLVPDPGTIGFTGYTSG